MEPMGFGYAEGGYGACESAWLLTKLTKVAISNCTETSLITGRAFLQGTNSLLGDFCQVPGIGPFREKQHWPMKSIRFSYA